MPTDLLANQPRDLLAEGQMSERDRKIAELSQGNWFERQLADELKSGSSSDQVAQGATLGFSPRILGAMNAPIGAAINLAQGKPADLAGEYARVRDQENQRLANYQTENPKTALASQVAGGFIAGSPVFKSIANPLVASGVTGGVTGAISGAGYSKGDWKNMLEGMAAGGVLGGTLGLAIPLLGKAVGKGWHALKNTMGWNNVKDTSIGRILQAMEDDGLTPEQAAKTLDQYRSMGKPMTLADTGENMRSLGAYVAKQPGAGRMAAKSFLENRQAGQVDRLSADVKKFASGDFWQNVDDLMAQRSTASAPAYQQALSKQGVWNDRIQQFLDDPIVKKGLSQGIKIQRLEALANGQKFNPSDYAITSFNDAGDPVLGKVPNMRTLDAIKSGLDDIVEKYRDPVTGKLALDRYGKAVNSVLRSFIKELDSVNPAYAQARAAYSGPSQSMDALYKGRNVFRGKDAEDVKKIIDNLSPGDKEFFKVGVVRAIQDKMESRVTGANKARDIFGTPKKEKIIAQVFGGQKQYQQFKKAVEAETAMHQTYSKVTGGSPTQPLQAEGNAMARGSMDVLHSLAQGRPLQALGALGRAASERVQGVNAKTTDQIAQILFADNPQALAQYGQAIMKTGVNEAQKQQVLRGILGLYAPAAGVSAGLLGQ